jgi:hypothetical protein
MSSCCAQRAAPGRRKLSDRERHVQVGGEQAVRTGCVWIGQRPDPLADGTDGFQRPRRVRRKPGDQPGYQPGQKPPARPAPARHVAPRYQSDKPAFQAGLPHSSRRTVQAGLRRITATG